MKIIIDPERITLDDLIALEEGENMKLRRMRSIMAKCAFDDNGAPIPDAESVLGQLTIAELKKAFAAFRQALTDYQSDAVSPTTGGES